jgi:hypothetical protein
MPRTPSGSHPSGSGNRRQARRQSAGSGPSEQARKRRASPAKTKAKAAGSTEKTKRAGTSTVDALNGVYEIISAVKKNRKWAIDLRGQTEDDTHSAVQIMVRNGTKNQRWRIIGDGTGRYRIRWDHKAKYWEPEDNDIGEGDEIETSKKKSKSKFQLWDIWSDENSDERYQISNVGSGLCVTADDWGADKQLEQWTWKHHQRNQQWYLYRKGDLPKRG